MIDITAVSNTIRVTNSQTGDSQEYPKGEVNFRYKTVDGANDNVTVWSNGYEDNFLFQDVDSPATANSAALMTAINALL